LRTNRGVTFSGLILSVKKILDRFEREIFMTTEIIGIDHIYIAVSNPARSERFYDVVMPLLGFKKNEFLNAGDRHVQYFNRHFGIVLRPGKSAQPHDPLSPGLHHFCFRVENLADLEQIAGDFRANHVEFSGPDHFPEYAPDYHAIFFSDPDGIRLEITNYRAERRKRHDGWPWVN
jgi:glyoxylase I family protein